MNIALLLTPKCDVVWLPAEASLAQAIEIMRPHRYTALPVLDSAASYVGTLTEGDILWRLLGAGRSWRSTLESVPVKAVPMRTSNHAVRIDAELEALVAQSETPSGGCPTPSDTRCMSGPARRWSRRACWRRAPPASTTSAGAKPISSACSGNATRAAAR